MPSYYTGIGSRETPDNILVLMSEIAAKLASNHFVLRSGGAKGADTAFENGATDANNSGKHFYFMSEIYLPWKNFNNNESKLYLLDEYKDYDFRDHQAYKIAKKYYPRNLDLQPEKTQRYMTRNVFQILGRYLNTPSKFVVCWTKDGKASGGTGQAIRIAEATGIPVYNLKNEKDTLALSKILMSLPE